MSLPVHVDGYSGWKANERPMGFELDGVYHRIYAVEDQWYSPDAQYFKVRADGKTYILRYNEREDEWSLESAFDGAELFSRPDIEFITVGAEAIREAERQIAGCEQCRPEQSQTLFDCILADALNEHGAFEFVLSESARCPNCGMAIAEKMRVEAQGGIEVDADVPV